MTLDQIDTAFTRVLTVLDAVQFYLNRIGFLIVQANLTICGYLFLLAAGEGLLTGDSALVLSGIVAYVALRAVKGIFRWLARFLG